LKNPLQYIAFGLLKFYKYGLSPMLSMFGVRCRHTPSCSDYARDAIERHGLWAGGWMTAARLSRCHPIKSLGGTHGVDNVPQSVKKPPVWAPWRYGHWRGTNRE
jgi:putative membrane protein insertion efficiency factor